MAILPMFKLNFHVKIWPVGVHVNLQVSASSRQPWTECLKLCTCQTSFSDVTTSRPYHSSWEITVWSAPGRTGEWMNWKLLWIWLCHCHHAVTTSLRTWSVNPCVDCYAHGNRGRRKGFWMGKVGTRNGSSVVWWGVGWEELWVLKGVVIWDHWKALWSGIWIPHLLVGTPPFYHHVTFHSSQNSCRTHHNF